MANQLITLQARANELTAVVHREVFDELPGGVSSEDDKKRWLKFRADYHRAQRLELMDFPLQIDFELNSTCNLACSFCTHGHEKVVPKNLGFEQFKKAIDEAEEHGLCSIKLNYINEPLLNPDLAAYANYAREHGVLNVYFATNGIALNRTVAMRLIDAKVSKIMVSLDAATPETFWKMRASEKFDLIVSNVRGLIDLRRDLGLSYPKVRVNFLKTKLNIHEAERFIAQWDGVADSIGLQDQVGLPGIDDDVYSSDRQPGLFRCSFPFKLVVIDSAGQILPCCTFSGRAMPLGNIAHMTVKEAWDSQKMAALKLTQKTVGYVGNPVCFHCVSGCNGS